MTDEVKQQSERFLVTLYLMADKSVGQEIDREKIFDILRIRFDYHGNILRYMADNSWTEWKNNTWLSITFKGLIEAEKIMETSYPKRENKVLRAIYEMAKRQPEDWVLINELEKTVEMSFQELNPILNDLENRKRLIGCSNEAVWILPAGVEIFANPQNTSNLNTSNNLQTEMDLKKVFIVHGQDNEAKLSVARFLEKLDLKPVILHEQTNTGKTIIEKFEHHSSDVSYAVVLLTPDDVGNIKTKQDELQPRARQNVIFELGYFFAKLGRERVCALHKEGIELPSDFQGVLYVPMDSNDAWKFNLAKELKQAGLDVDMNKI